MAVVKGIENFYPVIQSGMGQKEVIDLRSGQPAKALERFKGVAKGVPPWGDQRKHLVVYNLTMAKRKIRISEAEATSDFGALLARVRAGAEVVIERDAEPVAVVHPAQPVRRTISECIALLPEDSTATIDPDFEKDVEAVIESHRRPLNPPAWD